MISSQSFGVILAIAMSLRFVTPAEDFEILDKGYRVAYRVYEECQQHNVGLAPCLKKKAITFFDRVSRIGDIPITENMELVKNNKNDGRSYSDQELETLGRATGSSRDDILDNILFDKVASLLNGFDIRISLPKMTSSDFKRSIEEGRGKMKKMMGMMMMGMAMKMAAMIPLAIGVLFLIAGKALIISKLALVLSLIIGLKKLLMQKQGGGDMHGHSSGWQSGGGGGGWDRSMRSLESVAPAETPDTLKQNGAAENFAHSLAYKGQYGVSIQ
ncbi:uncharacterized protein LOC105685701 [Athalia rosae]|uniref:uncharacterized protein LOC105685701 n=1 Tax=Athalia rosae TaxID=37344 RepID=UPI0020343DEA|nr:uncharacterized protein LOC105685701 [Athalia rosae]